MPVNVDRPAGAPIVRGESCQLSRGPPLRPSPFRSPRLEKEFAPPTRLGRSQSAFLRDGSALSDSGSKQTWVSDSASVAGTLNGELDEDTLKRGRKRTSLSPSMESGDAMREALTYEPPLVTDLRSPDNPTQFRNRSSSPAREDDQSTREDDQSSFRSPLRRSSWCSSGLSDSGINEYMMKSMRRGSCASIGDTSSISRMSRLSSAYDPRAKPGSYASEVSKTFSSKVSCGASEDHLWRELFHSEPDEQVPNRLRGEGKTIGSRGMHSNGIPWRQIPTYDKSGRISETADPFADRKVLVKESGMTEKKMSQFSQSLSPGHGVRELLSPSKVSVASETFGNDTDGSYFESINILKQRLAAKYEKTPESKAKSTIPPTPSTQSGETSSSDSQSTNPHVFRQSSQPSLSTNPHVFRQASQPSLSTNPQVFRQMSQPLHFQWRHSKKGQQSLDAVKDSCPYSRIDSEGIGVKRLQSGARRPSLEPKDMLTPGCLEASPTSNPEEYVPRIPAEKVMENRRDWQLVCDKVKDLTFERSSSPPRNVSPARDCSPRQNRIPLRNYVNVRSPGIARRWR